MIEITNDMLNKAKQGNLRIIQIIQDNVKEEALKYINILKEHYFNNIISIPEYSFSLKGRTAGRCSYHKVSYNLQLLLENYKVFMNRTVPHEIAHWGEKSVYGVMGHKQNWKFIMGGLFKKEVSRCHSYDTTNTSRKTRKWGYTCGCGDIISVSTTIHNRVGKGRYYSCNDCGERIRFIGKQIV